MAKKKKKKKSKQDFRLVSFSLLKYFTLENSYFKFLPEAGFCIIYSPRLPDKKSWDPLRNMNSGFRIDEIYLEYWCTENSNLFSEQNTKYLLFKYSK